MLQVISQILVAWGRRDVPTVHILKQVIIHALIVNFHAQLVHQSQLALLVSILFIIITLPVLACVPILPLQIIPFVHLVRLLAKLVVGLSLIVRHVKLGLISTTILACLDVLLEHTIILMLVPLVNLPVLPVVITLFVLLALDLCI